MHLTDAVASLPLDRVVLNPFFYVRQVRTQRHSHMQHKHQGSNCGPCSRAFFLSDKMEQWIKQTNKQMYCQLSRCARYKCGYRQHIFLFSLGTWSIAPPICTKPLYSPSDDPVLWWPYFLKAHRRLVPISIPNTGLRCLQAAEVLSIEGVNSPVDWANLGRNCQLKYRMAGTRHRGRNEGNTVYLEAAMH